MAKKVHILIVTMNNGTVRTFDGFKTCTEKYIRNFLNDMGISLTHVREWKVI